MSTTASKQSKRLSHVKSSSPSSMGGNTKPLASRKATRKPSLDGAAMIMAGTAVREPPRSKLPAPAPVPLARITSADKVADAEPADKI